MKICSFYNLREIHYIKIIDFETTKLACPWQVWIFYEDSFQVEYNIFLGEKLMILELQLRLFHFDLGQFQNLIRHNFFNNVSNMLLSKT